MICREQDFFFRKHLEVIGSVFIIYSYLCQRFVPVLYSEVRMKRESGENPEQSRCCEFHIRGYHTHATVCKKWEGDTPETSQKTCKTKSKNCPFEESGQCTFRVLS